MLMTAMSRSPLEAVGESTGRQRQDEPGEGVRCCHGGDGQRPWIDDESEERDGAVPDSVTQTG